MRQRPITAPKNLTPSLKGTILCLQAQKNDNVRRTWPRLSDTFTFVEAHFDKTTKRKFQAFFARKKKEISVRFSERWRWWRNQGMAAIPSISHLSLIALYSSVLASFPDIFILCGLQFLPSSLPPLSSLCHLQLHRKKKKHPTLHHLPHRQHGNDYRACPDVQQIRPAPPAGPYTHGHLSDSKRLPQPADTCCRLSQLWGVQSLSRTEWLPPCWLTRRTPSPLPQKQKLKIHPLSVTDGAL